MPKQIQKQRLMLWDELNNLKRELPETVKQKSPSDIADEILDYLILAYVSGVKDSKAELADYGLTPSDLGFSETKTKDGEAVLSEPGIDAGEALKSVYATVGGVTFAERITKYAETEDVPSMVRVIETEAVRNYNEGVLGYAKSAGATLKTWETMLDDKVRDTHGYLQSMTVGINDNFFTYDGDFAQYPGGFQNAENNINCRCWITVA